jgi:uncharacterized RmlC-like cupin family protein
MTRERDRYGRKSIGEQVDDLVEWFPAHRTASLVILVFLAIGVAVFAWPRSSASVRDLRVGDCLYIPTGTPADDVRPIGDERSVTQTLFGDGAQQAGCDASHGHEVSAIVDFAAVGYVFAEAEVRCGQVFEAFVGHPLAGSIYATFAAVPSDQQQLAGATRAICLVARSDGHWMDHPARGSGE